MGSIPGPVIVFRISQPELAGAVNPALQQIRSQAKTVSDGIAEDWKRMAAQIRASVAQDATDTRGLASSRQQLISVLQRELALHGDLSNATNKQLANYKAVTLELERQASFLKGTGGLTNGTSNALNQVSTQTVLGITRMMDSLVDRYFGGAAGAAFRTVRDAGYYSSMARGAEGGTGTGGVFSGLTGGMSAIFSMIPPAVLGGGAFVAGLTATGGILAGVTDKMLKYAQAIQNQAAATGLSTVEVQRYNELAKITGVDSESLTTAFARMQVQLGEFVTKGQTSSSGTQNLTRVLNSLGVSITTIGGSLRPVNQVMGDFANVLAAIPDRETRTALALEAMGTRGRVLVQVMDEARASGETLAQALDKVGKATLPDSEIQQLLREKASWDDLTISIDNAKVHLEGFIATHKSAILAGIINPISSIQEAVTGKLHSYTSAGSGPGSPKAPTAADAQALIAQAAEATNKIFLERAEIIKAGGAEEYKLLQAEKLRDEAVQSRNGAAAAKYAQQVKDIKADIASQDRVDKLYEKIMGKAEHPSKIGLSAQEESDAALRRVFGGPATTYPGARPPGGWQVPGAPGVAPNFPGGIGSLLTGIVGGSGNTQTGASLVESLTKQAEDAQLAAIKDGVEKINIEYQRDLQNFRLMLQQKQISQEQFNEAVALEQQITNSRIEEVREKELDKYKQEAGSLFDALVSGQKNIGKKLQSAMEEIVLAPLKKGFDNVVARELQDLGDLFKPASQRTPSTSGGSTATGGVVARIYSKLGTIFGPLTPPTYGNNPAPPGGGGAGQSIVSTMRVQAGIVYVGGLGSGGGVGGIGAGDGLLGSTGAQLLSSAGFSGSSGFGSIGSNPLTSDLPFTANALKTTSQYMSLNTTSPSAGGFNLTASNGLGLLTGGAGLFAALTSANQAGGGAGGAFKGLLGGGASGAELGATIGSIFPGLGTVIGAGVGAIAGGISGLISGLIGSDWSTNVQKAMNHQNYIAPGSENFSFASNGSIANTLQTGFNNNGGTFSQNKLAANTPFWANAITGYLTWQQKQQITQAGWGSNPNEPFNGNPQTNPFVGQGPVGYKAGTSPTSVQVHLNLPGYIDGQGAEAALTPAADTIARIVASKFSQGSSGLGSRTRAAVNLP